MRSIGIALFVVAVIAAPMLGQQEKPFIPSAPPGVTGPRDLKPNPKAPVAPDLPEPVPEATVETFRAGPVTVSETRQPLDAHRTNVVLHLSDASGDAVEIDLQRLGDPTLDSAGTTYAYRTREHLKASSAGREYVRRLHALEAAVDRPSTGHTRAITMEETQLLLHATVIGLATGDTTAPDRFAARWRERAGRRPVQWRPDDCYTNFMRWNNIAYNNLYDCSRAVRDQRWYNQMWYSGSCGIEFTMRTASAYGNYLSCSHLHVGPAGPSIG